MGTDIDEEEFGEGDYSRFAERLEECLAVLGQLLARRGFGAGPATVGAELELFLVDGTADRCRVTRLSGPRRPIRALAVMLDRYLQYAETGLPVHTWPVGR